jgi:serine/threonine protein kinase
LTAQVIQREKLGVLTKIGQGGQGVVYRAPNVKTKFAASMVYKEYKTQTLADIDFGALAAMPALVEDSLSYAEAERLISLAAWPCALVEDAGASTGFVMPAIPDEFFIPLTTVKGVSTVIAEFAHLLNHPSVLAARGIDVEDAQRYSLLREVASGLAFLHKYGVCVGDISPKNLLFALSPHPGAYSIDCDAMRINGVSVLRQVETPDGRRLLVRNWPPSIPMPTSWACWRSGCSPVTTTPKTCNTSRRRHRTCCARSSPTPSATSHTNARCPKPGPTCSAMPSSRLNTAKRPQPQRPSAPHPMPRTYLSSTPDLRADLQRHRRHRP